MWLVNSCCKLQLFLWRPKISHADQTTAPNSHTNVNFTSRDATQYLCDANSVWVVFVDHQKIKAFPPLVLGCGITLQKVCSTEY